MHDPRNRRELWVLAESSQTKFSEHLPRIWPKVRGDTTTPSCLAVNRQIQNQFVSPAPSVQFRAFALVADANADDTLLSPLEGEQEHKVLSTCLLVDEVAARQGPLPRRRG